MVRVSSGVDSKQDYQTPADFIAAVEKRFGGIYFDLAATNENKQAKLYFAPYDPFTISTLTYTVPYGVDALKQDWCSLGAERRHNTVLWLNPPFQNIAPWAEKCRDYLIGINGCLQASTLCLLVPASVGANWFKDYVWGAADVYFLNGRLSFDGKAPYGKDCLLAAYHLNDRNRCRRVIWNWREDAIW